MHTKILRCFAECRHGQWQAFCIDLCLAAQDETFEGARRRLDAQILDYVHEACGEDQAHARELLARKAPFYLRFRYWYYRLLSAIHAKGSRRRKTFNEPWPVAHAH